MNEEIKAFLENKDYESIAERLKKPEDAAALLREAGEEHILPLCRALDSDVLADVLVLLDAPLQQTIVAGLHDDELEEVMEDVSVDDTVDIIEEVPEAVARRIAEEDEILALLKERKFSVLKPLLSSMNEIDLAAVFERAEEEDLPLLYRILPKDLAADMFVEIDSDTQEKLLKKLTDKEVKEVMDELFLDRPASSSVCSPAPTARRAPTSTISSNIPRTARAPS